MTTKDEELLDLEETGWRALAGDGNAAAFYRQLLSDRPVMLLPGGLRLTAREEIIGTMTGPPWDRFAIDEATVTWLTDDVALVHYRVEAARGASTYTALMSSTYVRQDGEWRLAVHQQTPTAAGSG
jgi:hypothetical protein